MISVLVFADRGLWHRLLEDVRRRPDLEACGLLLGPGSEAPGPGARLVTEVRPARNTSPEPATRYEVDVQSLFDAHREERTGGASLIGVYHSHPEGDARPSATDEHLAWPGYVYVIVGRGERVRAWRLQQDGFREERIEVRGGRSKSSSAMLGFLRALSLLATAYLLLAGLFLILFPWSSYWQANVFVRSLGADMPGSLAEHALRFFLTFFGAAHLVLAADDLLRLVRPESTDTSG